MILIYIYQTSNNKISMKQKANNKIKTLHVLFQDINFWGSVNATHFALPYLRKSKGRILVIGSVAGWFNTPKVSVYNASKAAQQSFFETLRLELAPDIGVSIMNLGLVDTYLATNEFIYKVNEYRSINVHRVRLDYLMI
ncbi:putative 11-beta-hydroxysteroid dehydrogenase [Helianthus annuus]|nr:putative 11-beta-hydroxysteroid dehydrogenase [Helianthus annuus]